jgi:hypothetical protein
MQPPQLPKYRHKYSTCAGSDRLINQLTDNPSISLTVFIVIIPLWVTVPRGNVHQTILEFTNSGGWNSDGLSYAIGTVPMIGMLIVLISVGGPRHILLSSGLLMCCS